MWRISWRIEEESEDWHGYPEIIYGSIYHTYAEDKKDFTKAILNDIKEEYEDTYEYIINSYVEKNGKYGIDIREIIQVPLNEMCFCLEYDPVFLDIIQEKRNSIEKIKNMKEDLLIQKKKIKDREEYERLKKIFEQEY